MTSDNTETAIRVVKFDGKDEKAWRIWNAKLRAIGTIKKWTKALDNTPEQRSSGIDM